MLASRTRDELRDPAARPRDRGAALAPDVDLLFRFVDGRNHHNDETHSLGVAFLAGLAGAVVLPLLRLARPSALALATSLGWASHTLLDYLNLDTNPPIGLMALWPWSDAHYKVPLAHLPGHRAYTRPGRRSRTTWWRWPGRLSCSSPCFWAALRYRSRRLGDEVAMARGFESKSVEHQQELAPGPVRARARWATRWCPPRGGGWRWPWWSAPASSRAPRAEGHREMLRRAVASLEKDLRALS